MSRLRSEMPKSQEEGMKGAGENLGNNIWQIASHVTKFTVELDLVLLECCSLVVVDSCSLPSVVSTNSNWLQPYRPTHGYHGHRHQPGSENVYVDLALSCFLSIARDYLGEQHD